MHQLNYFLRKIIYNSLHIESLVWNYVGEKGEEIAGRNSHSLHIISVSTTDPVETINCLVLYGGASPEHGPSGDAYYAILPSAVDDVGN